MCAEESVKSGPKKKTKTRVLKWGMGLAIVLILLVVFVLPWFISSERGRRIILAKINSSIDGEVNFAGLTMGWWKGVGITDISFNDVEGRISVRVKQIVTKPHYGSFLTGSLSLGETEIFEPKVEVNLARAQSKKQQGLQEEKSRPSALPIKRVEMVVKNGDLKVTDSRARSVELSEINTRLNLKSPRGRADFDVDLAVVDGGKKSKITANGRVAPGRGWRLKGTSGELTVEVNDLELGSLAPIFAMGGVEIEASGRISGNVESEIRNGRLEKMKAEVEGKELNVNAAELTGGRLKTDRLGVDVKLARAGEMINIESFDIESDWLKAKGRGAVPTTIGSLDEFLETDSSLTGSFELDAAQLFTQMPKVFRLKEGTVVTSGVMRGDVETLLEDGRRKIKGKVNLERLGGIVGGVMAALSEPVRAEAEITSDKGGVRFDKLGLSSAFARVNCSGTSELLRYRGSIDLARFQAELGQFVDAKGYGIAGELSGEGEIAIKESKFIVGGSTVVKNLKISCPGKSPFEQKEVSADFDAEADSAQKTILVKKFQIDSDQIKIQGRFSKTNEGGKTKVESQAECEYEWAAVSTIAAPVLPTGLVLEGQRKDTINFASEYPKGQDDKLAGNLNAKIKTGFTKGRYFGLNFGPTELDVQVENGLLKIAPFSTTVNNGQLSFAGEADLKQRPTLLRTPGTIQIIKDIQINEVTTRLLRYLNPIFVNVASVGGVANFNCERLAIPLAGAGKNDLEVVGTISITEMRLQGSGLLEQIYSVLGRSAPGQNITISPTKFVLKDGFLRYDDMQVIVGDNPINFGGTIGLDESLNMRVTLPYTIELKTVRVGKKYEGERISVHLGGTLPRPELDLDRLLGEQVPRLLMKGLEGVLKK